MHLYGRSSSHFTRIPRIFAAELGVDVEFHLIRNLLSADADDYGGNPALKMPTLQTDSGLWFGSLPICMAKTPYSLSHDPRRAGRPSGFRSGRYGWPPGPVTSPR